jgi:hypothetical protein
MEKVIAVFGLSFAIMMSIIMFVHYCNTEPRTHPSWYGTYYSFQDAMEDGWYDLEENKYAKN